MQENNIGSKIRNYRQKKGMTQDALAAELHVSAQAVSKWENGQTMPDISFLVPLSKILGLGLYELLGGDLREVYEKKWREADELCDDLALLAAEEALSEFPEDEEFLYRRAVAEYKLGKLEAAEQYKGSTRLFFNALEHFEDLVRRFPENQEYKSMLARTHFALGEKQEAFKIAYSLRNSKDLVFEFSSDEEREVLRQRKLKPMLTGIISQLRNINTRDSIRAAYGVIDAMCGDDVYLRNRYYRLICTSDALLCLDEGDIDGYTAKLGEAYECAKRIDHLALEEHFGETNYTAPIFNKLTYDAAYLWHSEIYELLYAFLNEKKLAHPASADIRRRMAEECFTYAPLHKNVWKNYFRFCNKYICDSRYSNYSTGFHVTEEEGMVKFNGIKFKPNGHARLVEIYKDEIEQLVTSGEMRGHVAFCGEDIVAFCHCGAKESFKQYYNESAAAPEGTRIFSIVDLLAAKSLKFVGVEEKLLSNAISEAKRSGYTHAEVYMIERMQRPSEIEHYDYMLGVYAKLGFEVVRDLSSDNCGRFYIMRKTLRTDKREEYDHSIETEKYQEILNKLKKKNYTVLPGMTDEERSAIERTYGFIFPRALADFYALGIPQTKSPRGAFPRWRDLSEDNVTDIKKLIAAPIENLRSDVRGGFWISTWGSRPESTEDAVAIFDSIAEKAPKLIPIYGHRYAPVIEGVDDPPVISVSGRDIIYYGNNLSSYLKNEVVGFKDPIDCDKFDPIPFWSDIIIENF